MAQRFKQLVDKRDEGWQFVNEGTEQVSAAPDASLQEIAFIQSTHDACSVWGFDCLHVASTWPTPAPAAEAQVGVGQHAARRVHGSCRQHQTGEERATLPPLLQT